MFTYVFFLSFFFLKFRKEDSLRIRGNLAPTAFFLITQELVFFSVFKAHLAQSCGVLGGGHIFLFLAAWPFVVT